MTRGYFVTGTDTGVGKTFAATSLTRLATTRGHHVFAFKPIETGCTPPLGDDQRLLVEASGDWQRDQLAGVYQLGLPAAPLVAAEAEGTAIDLDRIEQAFQQGNAVSSFTVVEGAGGWRVPVTRDADIGSLAKRLCLPVLLVARATLGTINHTLLSAEAIQRDGCTLAAVILSCRPTDDASLLATNLAQLSRHLSNVVVLEQNIEILDFLIQRST